MELSIKVLNEIYLNLPYEIHHYIAQTVLLNDDDEIILQVWVHLFDSLGHLLLSTTPFTYQHPLLSFLTSTSAMNNVNVFNEQCLLAFGPVWQALLPQDDAWQSHGVSDHTGVLYDIVGTSNGQTLQVYANNDSRKQVPNHIRIDVRK